MEEAEDNDVTKASSFLKDVGQMVSSVETSLLKLSSKIGTGDLDTAKGLTLLELKCHLMMNYLMDMGVILMKKCRGEKLNGISSIDRLVENRTVIEKLRPIELKLKYHIEKLIKVASGVIGSGDPLGFRANPKNLVSKLGHGEGAKKENEDGDEEKPAFYVPPKLSAVHYDEDVGDRKEKRRMEYVRKKALSSNVIRELRAEYYDGPDEIVDSVYSGSKRESKEAKHRREYEEEHMVRLNVSKKQRNKERNQMTSSTLDGLTNFGDISILTAEAQGDEYKLPEKRQKKSHKVKIKALDSTKGNLEQLKFNWNSLFRGFKLNFKWFKLLGKKGKKGKKKRFRR